MLSDDEVNLQCDNLQKELKELITTNDLSAFNDNPEEGISFNEELIYPSRLLTVDNHLVLPINMPISVRVTSTDVLHS
jgi:heme/copper-type cytochrome/quinol oxidase subunit 2